MEEQWLVVWVIDMEGESPTEASRNALRVMRDNDPDNSATCFRVLNKTTGEEYDVDLFEQTEVRDSPVFSLAREAKR